MAIEIAKYFAEKFAASRLGLNTKQVVILLHQLTNEDWEQAYCLVNTFIEKGGVNPSNGMVNALYKNSLDACFKEHIDSLMLALSAEHLTMQSEPSKTSPFIGTINKPYSGEMLLKDIKAVTGKFNKSSLFHFETIDGKIVKAFTQPITENIEFGQWYGVYGKITKHHEYLGHPETIISLESISHVAKGAKHYLYAKSSTPVWVGSANPGSTWGVNSGGEVLTGLVSKATPLVKSEPEEI